MFNVLTILHDFGKLHLYLSANKKKQIKRPAFSMNQIELIMVQHWLSFEALAFQLTGFAVTQYLSFEVP